MSNFIVERISFTGDSIDVSPFGSSTQDTAIAGDGSVLFVFYRDTDNIAGFPLAEPGVLESAGDPVFLDVNAQETTLQGGFVSPDGTRLFIVGRDMNIVFQYDFVVPNDLETASYSGLSYPVPQDSFSEGLDISQDGLKMIVLGSSNKKVYEHTLEQPYSLAGSPSYTGNSADLGGNPDGIAVFPDGESLIFVNESSSIIERMAISDFGLANATFPSDTNDIGDQFSSILGLSFTPKGDLLYVYGSGKVAKYITGFAVGPSSAEEIFRATYANASAAPPKRTALVRPLDVQRSIDTDVSWLARNPKDWTVKTLIPIGELQFYRPGNIFWVRDNQPGLRQGRNVFFKGFAADDIRPTEFVSCIFTAPTTEAS